MTPDEHLAFCRIQFERDLQRSFIRLLIEAAPMDARRAARDAMTLATAKFEPAGPPLTAAQQAALNDHMVVVLLGLQTMLVPPPVAVPPTDG